jgi:lipoyl(octanoyl) transferase
MRDDLTVGMPAAAGSPAVEWRVDDAPVAYDTAIAFMDARAAAIAAGREPELVWLLEHPPLYTSGTSAKTSSTPAFRCSRPAAAGR